MKKCSYCGKTEKQTRIVFYERKKYLCNAHRIQMIRHGYIKKITVFDRNEITVNGNICTMKLYNKYGICIAKTLFDKEYLKDIKPIRWGLDGRGYVYSQKLKIKLHQFILGKKQGFIIDHINQQTLDNRISNLRHVTKSQNGMNNKHKGYYYAKKINRWIVKIQFNKIIKHIGCFKTEEEAKKARRKAELKYFKKYARI